jgi:hypothetical protein
MSRSGYADDMDDSWNYIKWRGRVASSIRGKRGQKLLTEMLAALDAMPQKRLIADELVQDGEYCALGVLGAAKGLALDSIDPHDTETVAAQFDVAEPLVREIVFINDEAGWWDDPPEERWRRVRNWVARQISSPHPSPNAAANE